MRVSIGVMKAKFGSEGHLLAEILDPFPLGRADVVDEDNADLAVLFPDHSEVLHLVQVLPCLVLIQGVHDRDQYVVGKKLKSTDLNHFLGR